MATDTKAMKQLIEQMKGAGMTPSPAMISGPEEFKQGSIVGGLAGFARGKSASLCEASVEDLDDDAMDELAYELRQSFQDALEKGAAELGRSLERAVLAAIRRLAKKYDVDEDDVEVLAAEMVADDDTFEFEVELLDSLLGFRVERRD